MAGCRIALLFLWVTSFAHAQTNRYIVTFKDKNTTPFTVQQPEAFLSAKAIARRAHSTIAITPDDLPVTPSYVAQVRLTGAKTFFTSRWVNALLIEANSTVLATVTALPFVQKAELVAPGHKLLGGRVKQLSQGQVAAGLVTDKQLQMIGIDKMNTDGFRGEGVTISILDAGFPGVNTIAAFQNVMSAGQVKMTMDFISNSSNAYQYNGHGTEVFSIIGAQLPGVFSGGAVGANYLLFVTEDVASEYRVEEYNWLFAAEKADSAGTDIIQSSLGYNLFDDPSMDYKISDLNGKTAIITKAAAMARDRGIIVVVSAGNSGEEGWHYITPPADAEGILATGAVNSFGAKAGFSSFGPTADGRIKPDVVAMGQNTTVIVPSGVTGVESGTSVAAPLITSLAAGLLQAYPATKPADLVQAIKNSASQGKSPDNQRGYGLPNYIAVRNYLETHLPAEDIAVFPNPVENTLHISFKTIPDGEVDLDFYDSVGKRLANYSMPISWLTNPLEVSLSQLNAGLYIVRVTTSTTVRTFRFVKL